LSRAPPYVRIVACIVLSSDISVDLVLLQRIVARDERAVAELYDRHSRLVFSVIRRILRSASDAEDVLQETFVRVWSRADTYDAALGSPATWLTRIARNRAVDRLRAQRTRADVDAPVPDTPESGEIRMAVAHVSNRPDVRAEDVAVASALRSAVARLPEAQRVLIEAAYFEGYTHQELAARFDVPLGTIKTRIRTGLIVLRGDLEQAV
jgi:RNA polymerase sigma-70 factor, ECF subfamily